VYLLAAAVALAAVAVVWPRRAAPGGRPLVGMLIAAASWALLDAIELQVPTIDGKRLVAQIQYVGIIAVSPCFLHAAVELSGLAVRYSAPLLAAIWGIPLTSLVLVWTNEWHRWVWVDILPPTADSPFASYQYGWWFWVNVSHSYVLLAIATVALIGATRRVRRQFRTGMAAVLVAVALPWIGNFAYNTKLGPWPGLNWLTLSLGVSGSILVWVVLRQGLLDLFPHAREALFDKMTDAVIVLDRQGRLVFSNQAARETLALDEVVMARALGVTSLRDLPEESHAEVPVESGGAHRWLDVQLVPVRDRWGALAGRLLVARDVTLQKELEDEHERLIEELQGALRQVSQLEGLLPICASCRKVRDDQGFWGDVEEYVSSRARVEFTHGICPDCAKKLYPSIMNG
jgi:PAS domain-containing protein